MHVPPRTSLSRQPLSALRASSAFDMEGRGAFTLVELLTVMAVIVAILALAGPAVNSIKSSNDVAKAVYDIAGVLEQARAYATSNNTYVYVGFNESDANSSESARQNSGISTAIGRVTLAVVATKDGTSSYAAGTAPAGNLITIGKPQIFSNIHLADLTNQGQTPQTGSMSRPPWGGSGSIDAHYLIGSASCTTIAPFEYPLGTTSGAGKYTFSKVVQFDPQGVARVQINAANTIPRLIELGLQQTRGNQVTALTPPVTTGNVAVIQIEGISGSTHLYRP